jgi:hypothetical protein
MSPGIPCYELRAQVQGPDDWTLAVWQLPAPATSHVTIPLKLASLRGRNLALIQPRLLRLMARLKIEVNSRTRKVEQSFPLPEEWALRLALLFRTLAPMRNREKIGTCAEAVLDMPHEEAAYWLGMALHRKHPRRVLMALRCLVIDPKMQRQC